eukprot:6621621-Prymnesium_polylepis.1
MSNVYKVIIVRGAGCHRRAQQHRRAGSHRWAQKPHLLLMAPCFVQAMGRCGVMGQLAHNPPGGSWQPTRKEARRVLSQA